MTSQFKKKKKIMRNFYQYYWQEMVMKRPGL
jgi:hypothetical protein